MEQLQKKEKNPQNSVVTALISVNTQPGVGDDGSDWDITEAQRYYIIRMMQRKNQDQDCDISPNLPGSLVLL